MTASELRTLFLAKLKVSGLDAKDAKRSGFAACLTAPPWVRIPSSGFVVPYPDHEFERFRYLPALVDIKGKEIRYSQPEGKPTPPYFSPLFDWGDYLDRSLPRPENYFLCLTEGEIKAAAACKAHIPCIGLGGVWNFKAKNNLLVPELANLNWEEVPTYAIYDSDAVSNLQVVGALNTLARELLARGARVYPIILPPLPGLKKTGLDDYLLAQGAEDFRKLLESAEPWAASRALHELNDEYVLVSDVGNLIVSRKTKRTYSTAVFVGSLERNRHWEKTVTVKATNSIKEHTRTQRVFAAKEWMEWDYRAEVARIVYEPGKGTDEVENAINTWPGWACEPIKGDVSLWHKYMDYYWEQCAREERKWFEQWLAYPLQHPGTKLFTAVLAHSHDEGSGKSLVGYSMKAIYGENFKEIVEKQLNGKYTSWALNRQFVMGEEITGGDKRAIADRLKSLVTQETMEIDIKYVPEFSIRDCINYYFTSNHADSLFMSDADRRYFVHELKCGNLEDRDKPFVEAYAEWIHSRAGASALFYYFLDVDLTGFNPKGKAPATEAKVSMVDAARSELESWVHKLKTEPQAILPDQRTLLTLEELWALRPYLQNTNTTARALLRVLRSSGFAAPKQIKIRTGRETELRPRVWAFGEEGNRKALEAMNAIQLGAIYCTQRGIKRWGPRK